MNPIRPMLSIPLLALGLSGWVQGAPDKAPVSSSPSSQSDVPPGSGSSITAGAEVPAQQAVGLIGYDVRNLKDERLGEIDNLIVMPNGQVTAIVLGTGGVLGVGKHRYEIPWSQVRWQAGREYLTVDVARERMESEFSAFEPASVEPESDSKRHQTK